VPSDSQGLGVARRPPLLSWFADPALMGWKAVAKRSEDILFALLVLALLGPLMLMIAAWVRCDSPGPVLFRQTRIGLSGREFRMVKFRTMHADVSAPRAECRQAVRGDARVTRAGAFLRRTSFDELPQLFNVLRGDMSLVGPRPHAPGTLAAGKPFEEIVPVYAARHRMRPGMTGLAQVRGWRGETDTEEKIMRRVACDLEYIANWSPALDLMVLARTFGAMLRMQNAY
jgi:exopolysaccharide biosynthesis polyprenyl glycosylphosphotransferase